MSGDTQSAPPEPEPMRLVTLARTDGLPPQVLAEATDNPHLVIVPARRRTATRWRWCGWLVAHVPTGREVPMLAAAEIEVVQRATALVCDLDWSSAEAATYRDDRYARRCRQARRQAWDDFYACAEADSGARCLCDHGELVHATREMGGVRYCSAPECSCLDYQRAEVVSAR